MLALTVALLPRDTSTLMARWPTHLWTTLFTYGLIFGGFPLLCFMLWLWVRGK